MRRVMIVGQPGSGKSTLANHMGQITGLPVFHMDHIHWLPGWVERPRSEKTLLCRQIHARDRWIFEGGHSVTWPERLERADMLIWLDFPASKRLRRVVRRSIQYRGRTRPDLPEGCPERAMDRDFLRYIWRTRHSIRGRIDEMFKRVPQEKASLRLRTEREVADFLRQLRAGHWAKIPANSPE